MSSSLALLTISRSTIQVKKKLFYYSFNVLYILLKRSFKYIPSIILGYSGYIAAIWSTPYSVVVRHSDLIVFRLLSTPGEIKNNLKQRLQMKQRDNFIISTSMNKA